MNGFLSSESRKKNREDGVEQRAPLNSTHLHTNETAILFNSPTKLFNSLSLLFFQ